MTDMFEARRMALAALLSASDIDAAVCVPGPNFYYLTGLTFALMERPTLLFVTRDGSVSALIPELERSVWTARGPAANTVYWQDSQGYQTHLQRLGESLKVTTIAAEGQRMRLFEANAIRDAFPQARLTDGQRMLNMPRLRKSASETEQVRRAIGISETSLSETLEWIRAGHTEMQIRSFLIQRLFANGAEGLAFEPIVLAGAHSTDPHGCAGANPVRPGDAILFDFGANVAGYSADITRTVFCEFVSDQNAALYEAVRAANEVGRSIAAAQISCDALDRGVTDVLLKSGFAEYVVHKTGHGLGLDIHEDPYIMVGNMTALEPGMLITIEPGLYRPGHLGVRIEDDVVITPSGNESLSGFSRDIVLVGGAK